MRGGGRVGRYQLFISSHDSHDRSVKLSEPDCNCMASNCHTTAPHSSSTTTHTDTSFRELLPPYEGFATFAKTTRFRKEYKEMFRLLEKNLYVYDKKNIFLF